MKGLDMSNPDPTHDPDNVRTDDDPKAPMKTFKRTRTPAADSLSKLASLVGFCTGNFADPKTRPEEIKKFVKAERQRDHAARVRVRTWFNRRAL